MKNKIMKDLYKNIDQWLKDNNITGISKHDKQILFMNYDIDYILGNPDALGCETPYDYLENIKNVWKCKNIQELKNKLVEMFNLGDK